MTNAMHQPILTSHMLEQYVIWGFAWVAYNICIILYYQGIKQLST